MKPLLLLLSVFLLVSCSQEVPIETPTEVTPQPLEVVTGPFLFRDGITYHQDTNEPITGIVESFHDNGILKGRGNFKDGKPDGLHESFHENGQLWIRRNYVDGKEEGLFEMFDEDGNLTETRTYRNGELIEENLNP